MDHYTFNTEENRKILSKALNKNIVDIQVWKKRNGIEYEVLYFWPTIWWFRDRKRIDLKVFKNIIERG